MGDIDAPHIGSITCRRSVPNIMRSTHQPILLKIGKRQDSNLLPMLTHATVSSIVVLLAKFVSQKDDASDGFEPFHCP